MQIRGWIPNHTYDAKARTWAACCTGRTGPMGPGGPLARTIGSAPKPRFGLTMQPDCYGECRTEHTPTKRRTVQCAPNTRPPMEPNRTCAACRRIPEPVHLHPPAAAQPTEPNPTQTTRPATPNRTFVAGPMVTRAIQVRLMHCIAGPLFAEPNVRCGRT